MLTTILGIAVGFKMALIFKPISGNAPPFYELILLSVLGSTVGIGMVIFIGTLFGTKHLLERYENIKLYPLLYTSACFIMATLLSVLINCLF
jgi:xanthosine utilization system XapX-like protein